ncbi:thiamine phosphate synthase [soil metagenome]
MKGLYLVTPDWDDTHRLMQVTESALKGGVALLQYRHKTADDALRREQAQCLLALCRSYQVPFIINDHIALCMALDADGVHVGGTDASVAEARAQVGKNKIVGASCYGSLDLAREAHRSGASYVAYGGFYPSLVKKYPVTTSADIIAQSKSEIALPVVVIGGMTNENSALLVRAGADMVAVISSVYLAQDAQAAARGFAELFQK